MKADSQLIDKPFQPIKVSFIIESKEEYVTLLRLANLSASSLKEAITTQNDKLAPVNSQILYEFLNLFHERLITTNK